MNELFVKIIKRTSLVSEPKEIAKLIYCSDSGEAFFDENTITRICLGKIRAVNSSAVLPIPTFDDVGTFIVGISTLDLHYLDNTLVYKKVETRDDMYYLIGEPERFRPHNLTKDGQLIAPRTLASCVYDDYGTPIGESLNYLQDWIDNIIKNGIPAEWITTGLINISRIPKSAQMDFKVVANKDQRLKLTIDDVQNGDVVQESETYRMYFIVDETKLGTDAAFREFTVGNITWQQVLQRPLSLTLAKGAVGSVSFETGSTIASQKLAMDVSLNMDYANSGVLNVLYGGTGTQDGTAPFVRLEDTTDKIYLAGKRSDSKSLNYTSEVEVVGGTITANGIHTDDSSVMSSFAGGINVTNGIIQGSSVKVQSNGRNLISYDPAGGPAVSVSNTTANTTVNGYTIKLNASNNISFTLGVDKIVDILSTGFVINLPVKMQSLEVSSLSNVSAKVDTDVIGWKSTLSGRTRSYTKSTAKGMIFNTTNFRYAFRASDSLVDNTPTNLVLLEAGSATFEVPTFIGNTFKVLEDSTFLSKVTIEKSLNVERTINMDYNHTKDGIINIDSDLRYYNCSPTDDTYTTTNIATAYSSLAMKFYHTRGYYAFIKDGDSYLNDCLFIIGPERIMANVDLDVYGNIRSKRVDANRLDADMCETTDSHFLRSSINSLAVNYTTIGSSTITGNIQGKTTLNNFSLESEAYFSNPGYDKFRGIWGDSAVNYDRWRVGTITAAGDTVGMLELGVANKAAICARQYSGVFSTVVRQANILDTDGNTSFPGTVTAKAFSGNATSATNADKLDGYHASDFVRKSELTASGSSVSPVVVSATEPAKRANGLWVNTSNGLLYYCASTSSAWTPVSSRWA